MNKRNTVISLCITTLLMMHCGNSDTSIISENSESNSPLEELSSSSSMIELPSSMNEVYSSSSMEELSSSIEALSSSSSAGTNSSSSSMLNWCKIAGNCGTFTDTRDERIYKWTKVGTQIWMAENLAYLPAVNAENDLSYDTPKYYVMSYDGTDLNDARALIYYPVYGALYNWSSAMEACPAGWHLPSSAEWGVLENRAGGVYNAGIKLKAIEGWAPGVGEGTDYFAFTALPSGYLTYPSFAYAYYTGEWWTATDSIGKVWYREMSYASDRIRNRSLHDTSSGLAVRCIKDDTSISLMR